MIYWICLIAFGVAFLTFFSGFGLGTILMPIIAIYFPLPIAIAITAVVHLLNNLAKFILLWKHVDWALVLHFGIAAFIASIFGAYALTYLSTLNLTIPYTLLGFKLATSPLQLIIGILLIIFATLELFLMKQKKLLSIPIEFGGMISGFFGGLSGHQGAFRSLLLLRYNLNAKSFIATNATLALVVDITRITIYFLTLKILLKPIYLDALLYVSLAAILGTILSRTLLYKTTYTFVHYIVGIMLYIFGTMFGLGLI